MSISASIDGFSFIMDDGRTLILKGLPDSVSGFLSQRDQLKQDIADLENYHPVIATTVKDAEGVDVGDQQVAEEENEDKIADAAAEKNEKLEQMRSSLEELDEVASQRTKIRAYFTGEYWGHSQIWQCVQ
jgi:hypothetical protein